MKYVKAFWQDCGRVVALWFAGLFVFALTFLLFCLPWEAFFYGSGIWSIFVIGDLVRKSVHNHTKKKDLKKLMLLQDLTGVYLPDSETSVEEAYQKIIWQLCEEMKGQRQGYERQAEDMISYYTLWVHQIKTPIASMGLTVQNEDSPMARRVRADLLRIEQYVEMVLTYLRLDMTETDYVFTNHDIDAIVRQALKKYRGEFAVRKLGLEYEPVKITAVTDEKWLSFVIEQVLSNALKYTTEGMISIYREGASVLCIGDTGFGITPEEVPRVFERGYTGSMGRRDKRASGIGLYLAKRICDRLGHGITLTSELGQGTRVRIDFTQHKGFKK